MSAVGRDPTMVSIQSAELRVIDKVYPMDYYSNKGGQWANYGTHGGHGGQFCQAEPGEITRNCRIVGSARCVLGMQLKWDV